MSMVQFVHKALRGSSITLGASVCLSVAMVLDKMYLLYISLPLKTVKNAAVAALEKSCVNSYLNPFCNGVVISINAGIDVIFGMFCFRNQSWSFEKFLREVDGLKKMETFCRYVNANDKVSNVGYGDRVALNTFIKL